MAIRLQNAETTKPEEFPWGWIRWLMSDGIDAGANQTVGVVQIDSGQQNPVHTHPNCEELLLVTQGTCEHVLADETITMRAGDMIRIPAGVPHNARAIGDEPMQAMIIFSAGDRKTQGVD